MLKLKFVNERPGWEPAPHPSTNHLHLHYDLGAIRRNSINKWGVPSILDITSFLFALFFYFLPPLLLLNLGYRCRGIAER